MILDTAHHSAISTVDGNGVLFYAHLYVSLCQKALGNSAAAKLHITKTARDFSVKHYMGDVTRIYAERLQIGN